MRWIYTRIRPKKGLSKNDTLLETLRFPFGRWFETGRAHLDAEDETPRRFRL